ncbi:hypothetical protein ACJEIK_25885 [Mycobacterium sp. SMC-16]|uniref:hypothetical protein n=1 Tax=Mycobacteriaceae TaxID=1762 RepID=UPI001CFAB741|nr:hypothetical protein [Mycolicibacterium phocaicum]UCZ60142.1 hypothetical protein LHJ73_26375 [Mycolicibacterium phocaicum]
MDDDVNSPVPQLKSVISPWRLELLDAVADTVQAGQRRAFAVAWTDIAFVQRSVAQIVQIQLAQLLTQGARHLSTSNSRRPINAR